jgi:chromosome transmission fidelity protein 4
VSIAIGDHFLAVATSMQFVRVFSFGGVQTAMFSVPGPVVTLTANGALLAVVYHRSAPWRDNQNQAILMYNAQQK